MNKVLGEHDKLAVEGGEKLFGSVEVSGAKNAALPILTASMLSNEESIIKNVPVIGDVDVQIELLQRTGAEATRRSDHEIRVDGTNAINYTLPNELTTQSRGSVLFMGALLARLHRVQIGLPGGDAIGRRQIDFHLEAFQAMGARVVKKMSEIELTTKKLRGAHIFLRRPSTTATENIMLAASLAEGTTVIENAEKVPEIVDLAKFLKSMGAKIKGEGSGIIKIIGVEELTGATHNLIPDPFEAGTYMVASAITLGELLIENAIPLHIIPTTSKLREAGVSVINSSNNIRVTGKKKIGAIEIYASAPYPAFQSDMQPIFAALMSVANGKSIITDSVFEKRFTHVPELRKLGANIRVKGNSALIKGVRELKGANVRSFDIRQGAALVLAGLAARGETIIEGVHIIDRGYEGIEEKLRSVGAKIRRTRGER
jgi:UDP-N-acetylglucosamine 1-carboxyvinyltransferase